MSLCFRQVWLLVRITSSKLTDFAILPISSFSNSGEFQFPSITKHNCYSFTKLNKLICKRTIWRPRSNKQSKINERYAISQFVVCQMTCVSFQYSIVIVWCVFIKSVLSSHMPCSIMFSRCSRNRYTNMPAISGVYQPTTYNVGYEQHPDWSQQPRRNRMSKLADWLQSDECCRRIFIASCVVIVLFIVLVMLEFVLASLSDFNVINHDDPVYTVVLYVCLFIVGIACILALALVYLRFVRHKRFYFWPFVRTESLARQMSSQGRNGQVRVH